MISKMIDGQEVLMSGTSEALIAQKADKVASATNGNIASLDASGNLTDSGVKGDMSTTTLNGNPLSFTTDSEQAARECVITFEPIQAGSGDPSPSNVRAISGYDNVRIVSCKNVLPFSLDDIKNINIYGSWNNNTYEYNGISFTLNSDGTVTVSGTTPSNLYSDIILPINNIDTNEMILSGCPSGGSDSTYYLVAGTTTTRCAIDYGNGGSRIVGTPDRVIIRIINNVVVNNLIFKPIIYDAPATDITLNLPETVYGGTLGLESGELVVDRVIDTVGNENITWSRYPSGGSHMRYVSQVIAELSNNDQINTKLLSDQLIPISATNLYNNTKLGTVAIDSGGHLCILPLSDYSSAQEFVAALSDVQIVYPLATPYTIHLTPAQVRLLQGNNVVTTNGTSIKLTYRNGEVATLADVSSVAESVNALGEKIEEVEDYTDKLVLSNITNVSYQNNRIYLKKHNNVVDFQLICASGYNYLFNGETVATLPNNARPKKQIGINFPVAGNVQMEVHGYVAVWILPTGEVKFYSAKPDGTNGALTAGWYINFQMSYLV